MINLSHDERHYLVEMRTKINHILTHLHKYNEGNKECIKAYESSKALKVDIITLQMIYQAKQEKNEQ